MTSRAPGADGDYLRFKNIFPLLAQTCDITLLYLDAHQSVEYFEVFSSYFEEAAYLHYQPMMPTRSARVLDFLTFQSEHALYRRDPDLRAKVTQLVSDTIKRKRIDLILSWVRSAEQFLKQATVPVLFDLCDALSLQLYRELRNQPSPRNYLYYQRIKHFESGIVAQYPVTFVSQNDANWFERRLDASVIPNGVDLTSVCKPGQCQESGSIVFSGAMGFKPNVEAVLNFADAVLPSITARYPRLTWYIVGTNPAREILDLRQRPNLVVTGKVDSIAEYICRAQVVICPMISGSGIKNKVLEAMALQRPVVSTRLGVEGIMCTNGENVLIADHPLEFANAVLRLLGDEGERQRLAIAGRQLVATHYTWTETTRRYEALFDRLIHEHTTTNRTLR
ncbi:MAG: glycosyltransferase family 4 protein [Thiohalocapsa sp.]